MSKPKFFLHDPAPGKPLSLRGLASGLRAMAYALQNLSMHDGHINWGPDGAPKIIYDKGNETDDGATTAELAVTVSGTTFTVAAGEFLHGTSIAFAGDSVDGAAASLDDERWVGVKVDFGVARSAEAFFTDDGYKHLDEGSIVYFHLSKWKRTASSWAFVKFANPLTEQHGVVLG